MQTLIDNYTAFEDEIGSMPVRATQPISEEYGRSSASSIIFRTERDFNCFFYLNEREIKILDELEKLQDNWDGELAIAPTRMVIIRAKFIVKILQATGQKVFHVAPGPSGEILVDIRNGSKSIELLFYPDKTKFVTYSDIEKPQQGIFESNILPQLLSWLNA
jgi:hypothetical protein